MKKLVNGVYAMLVTPMFPNGSVNYSALRKEVFWAIEHGAVGVVVTPSIGEFACLTDAERWECFRNVAEVVDKFDQSENIIKIAMVADTCTTKVKDHIYRALDHDYDAAQLIPPYYWIPDDEEVFDHYALVADKGLPLVVYHNPMLSKVHMSIPLLKRIVALDGIVGLKEVETDRQTRLEPLFGELSGLTDIFLTYRAFTTGMLLGASGGFANIQSLPFVVKMYSLWNEGKRDEAEAIQNMLNIVLPRGGESNRRHIGTNKIAASLVTGIDMGAPRAPYLLPDISVQRSIESKLPSLWEMIR